MRDNLEESRGAVAMSLADQSNEPLRTEAGELEAWPHSPLDRPWPQLLAGIVAMVSIANLQYGWTLFVKPIDQAFHWGEPRIQVAFTLFVLMETWLVPIEGYLVDRFGPRLLVAIGGILVGLAWVLNALAASLPVLYLGAVAGGAGAGIVYGTSIGNALKWFPRRRGLAAGLTAAAFGAGSALTVWPISRMIHHQGYAATFFWFGLGQGALVLACACLLRAPRKSVSRPDPEFVVPDAIHRDLTCRQMIQTPLFWLLYVMFTMVAMGGLMATAQLGPIARYYHIAESPVSLFGITMAALPFALSLDRILNGLSRPAFGWLSDYLGRENTIFLAFSIEGLAILFLTRAFDRPAAFVILTGLTFFAWGEIYSLFPALCADLFGRRYATTNYGLLYTAKGTASLLVPLGSQLVAHYGTWKPVFLLAIAFDWTAALLAILVLKPMRQRWALREAVRGVPGFNHGSGGERTDDQV